MICPCGATPQLFLRVDAWITGAEKVLRPDIAIFWIRSIRMMNVIYQQVERR
jgi:hypothetical protein